MVAGPVIRDLGQVVERVMGGADSVRRRQLRAGLAADVDRFRAEQVLWGALGAVVGAAARLARPRAAGCRGASPS